MSCMDGRRGPVEPWIAGLCRLRKQTPESRVVLKDQLGSQVPGLCITADTFTLLIVILVLLTTY